MDNHNHLKILTDERIRSIAWKDLLSVTKSEVIREILLPLVWLSVSLIFAHFKWYPVAIASSFMFFLAGLRIVHGAHHYSLGISQKACEWTMFMLSVLMLGSMHAIQVNHLRHHKLCMGEGDVEALSAKMSAVKAILLGPFFPIKLHLAALQHGTKSQIQWIYSELAANILWIILCFCFLNNSFLKYHIFIMAIGQCFTAFFAVWTVHHGCDDSHFIARTIRNQFKSFVTLDMFYHIEHHLFPKVPTCHLHLLSQRVDEVAPELKQNQVF